MISRFSRKPFAVLTVLLVSAVATCLLVGKMQARKEFVSRRDPATGGRCRFTLSANWRSAKDTQFGRIGTSPGDYFRSPATSPIRQWIATVLFHQATAGKNAHSLSLYILQTRVDPSGYYISTGYPAYTYVHLGISSRSRHLTIAGCPATLTPSLDTHSGQAVYRTMLIVRVPHSPILYQVMIASEGDEYDQADAEMAAILSSFHVEQGAVTGSGKTTESDEMELSRLHCSTK